MRGEGRGEKERERELASDSSRRRRDPSGKDSVSRARARREHRVVNLSRANNNPRARPPISLPNPLPPPTQGSYPFELFIFLMGFNFVETT